MAGNLVGEGPALLDWEYCQRTDAGYDAACLLTYYPSLAAHRARLLGAMGIEQDGQRAVGLQMEVFATLTALWERVHIHGAG
jgi:hypothetical protein